MLPLEDLHSQLDEALNINVSDASFSSLYYTDLINEQRALFIRNEYNKKRTLDPNVQQTIPCLSLELVDPHNCCVEVPVGCKILRTVQPLPNTIEFHHKKAITSVGPVVITAKRFTLIDYSRVPYIGEGRTTKTAIYAFLYDNYIYIISKDPAVNLLESIAVRGIFEDPTALADLTSCEGKPCWSTSDIYPLNQWMWPYVKEAVLQQLFRKLQLPLDDTNNANDDKLDTQMAAPQQQQKK
jgi:hypothetical protein